MVCADCLRYHFFISQPKAWCSRVRGYLSDPQPATCPEKSRFSCCSPFSSTAFLAAATSLFSSTTIGLDKIVYSMLKHLSRSGMDFLLHIFNLSWSMHSFPSIWKTSSIIPIHKMEGLSIPMLPFGLSLSPTAPQSFLNTSFYHVYSCLWSLISFSLPTRLVSILDNLPSITSFIFLSPFRISLTNPGRVF